MDRLVIILLGFTGHATINGARLLTTLFAIDLGASPTIVGLTFAAFSIGPMLLAIHAGRFVDRLGTRIPLQFGFVVSALAIAANAAWPGLATVLATAPFIGIAFLVHNIAAGNATAFLGPAGQRTANFGWLTLGFAAGTFTGPLLGGGGIDLFGHRAAFALLTMLPLGGLAVMAVGGRRLPDHRVPVGTAPQRFVDLLASKPLRVVLVINVLFSAVWDIFIFMIPVYCKAIGMTATLVGVVMGWHAISSALVRAAIPVLLHRVGDWTLMTTTLVLVAIALALFPATQTPWVLMLLSFLAGIGIGLGTPVCISLGYGAAPPGRQGEFAGLRSMATATMHSSLPLAAGALAGIFGVGAILVAAALLGAAGGWYVHRERPKAA